MSDISCPACGALIPVPNDGGSDDALRFIAAERKQEELRSKVAELEAYARGQCARERHLQDKPGTDAFTVRWGEGRLDALQPIINMELSTKP